MRTCGGGITVAIDEWESSDRHPDYLFGGSRPEEFDAWSHEGTLQLTDHEREFMDAGLDRVRAERSEARERLQERSRLERPIAPTGTTDDTGSGAAEGPLRVSR